MREDPGLFWISTYTYLAMGNANGNVYLRDLSAYEATGGSGKTELLDGR